MSVTNSDFDAGRQAWEDFKFEAKNPHTDTYSDAWREWEEGWRTGYRSSYLNEETNNA